MCVQIFQVSSDEGRVNKVKLSSFQLKNIIKFVLVRLAREKQNILTPHMFTYSYANTILSANQSARVLS